MTLVEATDVLLGRALAACLEAHTSGNAGRGAGERHRVKTRLGLCSSY